jgi:hypothetical protein
MGFDQYHEPADGPSQEARTFVRTIASLIEAAEAISWYEQRISSEKNEEAKGIMADAQKQEFKRFGTNLEFLLRGNREWRAAVLGVLFKDGDIVELDEKAEKRAA